MSGVLHSSWHLVMLNESSWDYIITQSFLIATHLFNKYCLLSDYVPSSVLGQSDGWS